MMKQQCTHQVNERGTKEANAPALVHIVDGVLDPLPGVGAHIAVA